MTLTLLHKRTKFAENMSIEILASNSWWLWGLICVYHTQVSCIVSCVRISEQDVGDLPVLTFGNCVLNRPE